MEAKEIILNAIEKAKEELEVDLSLCDTPQAAVAAMSSLLAKIRKRNWIPKSLYDEKQDLENRLKRNMQDYVGADGYSDQPASFNNGFRPNTEEAKHIDRFGYIERLQVLNSKINEIENGYDVLRDRFKELIELLPNSIHVDVMKQYYIYSKRITEISAATYLSAETIRQYRNRGTKKLGYIVFETLHKKE